MPVLLVAPVFLPLNFRNRLRQLQLCFLQPPLCLGLLKGQPRGRILAQHDGGAGGHDHRLSITAAAASHMPQRFIQLIKRSAVGYWHNQNLKQDKGTCMEDACAYTVSSIAPFIALSCECSKFTKYVVRYFSCFLCVHVRFSCHFE